MFLRMQRAPGAEGVPGPGFVALLMLAALACVPAWSEAATAVAVDNAAHEIGVCDSRPTIEEARRCALAACARAGGRACTVQAADDKGIYGAVAEGDRGAIGYTLGYKDAEGPALASKYALFTCVLAYGDTADCAAEDGQCQAQSHCKVTRAWKDDASTSAQAEAQGQPGNPAAAARPASAIAYDSRSGDGGYCHARTTQAEAEQCALEACRKRGGQECKVMRSTGHGGYSALAVGNRGIGVALTYNTADGAAQDALAECLRGGAVQCKLVAQWQDGERVSGARDAVPLPAPSAPRASESMIRQSYLDAFGREPDDREMRYWKAVSDVRVASADALFRNHLQYLAGYERERAATAIRALHAAFSQEEARSPRLRAFLDDPNGAAVKNAIVDMMAGRNGGGYKGILSYLEQPEVKAYYTRYDGIGGYQAADASGAAGREPGQGNQLPCGVDACPFVGAWQMSPAQAGAYYRNVRPRWSLSTGDGGGASFYLTIEAGGAYRLEVTSGGGAGQNFPNAPPQVTNGRWTSRDGRQIQFSAAPYSGTFDPPDRLNVNGLAYRKLY